MTQAWPMVELGTISESRLGKMLSPESKTGAEEMPYLGNADVRWGRLELEGLRTMMFTSGEQLEFSLRRGDVLICEGGEVGRTAVVDEDLDGVFFQKALHRVRCSDDLDPRYLFRFMRFAADTGRLDDFSSQATIKHLTGVKLRRLPIPLPPIEEQRRIAAVLDAADDLRTKRRQALAKLDTLTQAIFIDMFGDPGANPEGLEVLPLIELVDPERPITYGILKPGADIPDGVPYVRVVDMVDGGVDHDAVRRTAPEISQQYKRSVLLPGDLLMSIRGHVGRLALTPTELEGANITQDTARLAIIGAEAEYMLACLRSESLQRWMRIFTKGAAVKGINLGDVKKIPIPLPDAEQQRSFAERSSAVALARRRVLATTDHLDTLFSALQQRAFAGEL